MSYSVLTIPPFDKQLKSLYKKYPSIKTDIGVFVNELIENPLIGKPLGHNCYKIRIAIKSKNKGKSGGARIITHVSIVNSVIYFLNIYDKSEKISISDAEIRDLLSFIES
ncbi:MAG: type II toxin-antitoxin system RelE/ParE family toxin [Prolixibacteraceae bacterium]|jgi:mRNA-degrading endonuclease RelE of RelBE toxin-antitoxin system|nr:type II toxin-antitoxin system RelE/ParE family toxin [Prolixibacteraceae bacterium]